MNKEFNKEYLKPYIKALAEENFNTKVTNIKYLGGGSYGRAYKVDFPVEPYCAVLKAYKVSGMHLDEKFQVSTLSEHSIIKFPQTYFSFDATEDIPYDVLAMEYIKGKIVLNPVLLFKSKSKKKRFAEAIAENSLKIHSATNDKFGYLNNPHYDTWQEFYFKMATEIIVATRDFVAEGKMKRKYLDTMERAYANFDAIFDEDVKEASLIHGDLNIANILIDTQTLEPLAIIDPFNSMWADREYDLFQFNNILKKTFNICKIYKSKYKTSEKCDLKLAFYALFNEALCAIKSGYMLSILLYMQKRELEKQLKLFNIK